MTIRSTTGKMGLTLLASAVVVCQFCSQLECVTNEKDINSFQCFMKDEGGPLIYDLRE